MTREEALSRLGLKPNATLQEIKKEYRKLSKAAHPDKNPAQGADQLFRLVQEAYEVLTSESPQEQKERARSPAENDRAEEAARAQEEREREARARAEREKAEKERAAEEETRNREARERQEREDRAAKAQIQERRILYEHLDVPDINTFDVFRQYDGYKRFEKALDEYQPDEITDMVMKSGLKGRGGAGFSTGLKWSFVPRDIEPRYLCCNADESEPGTFSNRYVLEKNPHLLIEGILICCYAMGIHTTYIYIRGEFTLGKQMLDQAIEEAYQHAYLGKNILGKGFDLDVYSHPGAGAYICGEETGLIESLEGKRGQPRNKPPFPAVSGVFNKPTVVQNVETLCNLPFIVDKGVEWYTSMGPTYGDTRFNPPQADPNTGTKLYCISGDVNKPGVYELDLGLTCEELIEVAGGLRGNQVKAVIPGGSSAPILTHYELDTRLDFTALTLAKSMLGSGGIIVMNETRNIVDCLLNIMKFYAHESCGQCTPCRWGTPWVRDIVQRIADGEGRKSTITRPKFGVTESGRWGDTGETEEIYEDLDLLESVANNIANVDTMTWNTICVFGIAVSWPAVSYMRKFRPEFEACIREGELVTLPVDEATVPPEENYAYQQRIIPKVLET